MQIILLETLNKLGKAGEIVTVKDGFAKNFLIPRKKAVHANKKNRDDLSSKMSQIKENNDRKIKEANEIKSKLSGQELTIHMEANEEGNLYGNLSAKLICDQIKEKFLVDIDTGNVILGSIKELGSHTVLVRIYDDISVELKLDVVK